MDKVQNFVMPPNDPLSDVPKDLKDFVPEPQVVQSKEEPETIPRIDVRTNRLASMVYATEPSFAALSKAALCLRGYALQMEEV